MTSPATARQPAKPPRFFYGWWIVFASASIVFLSAGTFFYGFGLLVTPLTLQFGWSRAAISVAFSLRTEVGGVAAPLVGFLVDRVGVRRLVIGGVCIVVLGFVLLSRVQSLWAFYGAVVVIAVGMSATGGASGNVAIAHWFRRRRSRALGLMTLGGGTGGLMAIVFAWLISSFGWRDALLVIAVAQLTVALPLALTLRNRPEDIGQYVDGIEPTESERAVASASAETGVAPSLGGLTTKEALRQPSFWKIALGMSLSNFATTAIIVHQVPFLTESVGMADGAAAASVTAMTAMSLVGRVELGSLADIVPKRLVMAASMLCVAVALLAFASVHEIWQLAYALPLFAVGFGALIPLRASIQAEYFGLKAFGAVQGLVLTVATIGGFVGPVLAGWIYDQSDSYRLAFVILAVGPLIGFLMMLTARAPRAAESEMRAG